MKLSALENDDGNNLSPLAKFHCRSADKSFYDHSQGMKITFWKSFGMGVADVDLPPAVLASLKREFADEMHALKYVIFNASNGRAPLISGEEIEQILGIADTAKKYSLNHIEFSTACRNFCTRPSKATETPNQKATPIKLVKSAQPIEQLPIPKPGLILFRRDNRRKGACSVVSLEESFTWVQWHHNKKKSRIATKNLRSKRLYSTRKVF